MENIRLCSCRTNRTLLRFYSGMYKYWDNYPSVIPILVNIPVLVEKIWREIHAHNEQDFRIRHEEPTPKSISVEKSWAILRELGFLTQFVFPWKFCSKCVELKVIYKGQKWDQFCIPRFVDGKIENVADHEDNPEGFVFPATCPRWKLLESKLLPPKRK